MRADELSSSGTVWITGASTGIGRALALRLARDGWRVAASARSQDKLEELVAEAPDQITAFALDVTDLARVKQVHGAIETAMGPLDLVVLAAGTYTRDGAFGFSAKTAHTMIAANLEGTCNALEPALAAMMARGRGQIAVVASVTGYAALPGAATYSATKAGLNSLVEAMKPEAARRNVLLSVINPGFVDTPLTAKNDFPMPFMISADTAAGIIARGLYARKAEIAFPWQMVLAMKTLRALPRPLRLAITRHMVRED